MKIEYTLKNNIYKDIKEIVPIENYFLRNIKTLIKNHVLPQNFPAKAFASNISSKINKELNTVNKNCIDENKAFPIEQFIKILDNYHLPEFAQKIAAIHKSSIRFTFSFQVPDAKISINIKKIDLEEYQNLSRQQYNMKSAQYFKNHKIPVSKLKF